MFNFDNSYRQLPAEFYSEQFPAKVLNPKLVCFNTLLANELNIDFASIDQENIAKILSGNAIAKGSQPIAQAYAGHQFGHFNMLGDGRAILLGEHLNLKNERFDIQLKGSGETPYSRRGDGKATLSAMLREYLISEAMHHLNISSTRSLAVVHSGEKVVREQLYDGAILTRVAKSHIRVGTFEFVARFQGKEKLKIFCDYTIARHYPELINSEKKYLHFFKKVLEQQMHLIIDWMRVGFIHGVMNTDNTSIAGETIDYGPCAFMNAYNPRTVYSSIDHQSRYAYFNQPAVIQWNLSVLASSLIPLVDDNSDKAIELLKEILNQFPDQYTREWEKMMLAKIGVQDGNDDDVKELKELLNWMQKNKADYTNTFLKLEGFQVPNDEIYSDQEFKAWLTVWSKKNNIDRALMRKNNPVYIPRNHQVENALYKASEEQDMQAFNDLLKVLSIPYEYRVGDIQYMFPPNEETESEYQTYCGT